MLRMDVGVPARGPERSGGEEVHRKERRELTSNIASSANSRRSKENVNDSFGKWGCSL